MTVKSLSHSSLEDNRFYRSMLAGNTPFSPSAFDLLETQVLSSSAASVTFTGLGSYTDYKHLQIRLTARTDSSASSGHRDIYLTFNSDTGANYAKHRLIGTGSSVTSAAETSQNRISLDNSVPRNANPTGQFGAMVIDILDFSSSSKNTTIRTLAGALSDFGVGVRLFSGFWNNTAAVTSINFALDSDNYLTGSRFSLYGVKG